MLNHALENNNIKLQYLNLVYVVYLIPKIPLQNYLKVYY